VNCPACRARGDGNVPYRSARRDLHELAAGAPARRTFFSGPDAGLSTEVPSVATPDKTSDAAYEKSMGIKEAIDNKTMKPVEGINSQSFTATGCAGKKDGKVTFTFDRAFIGDYDYAPAGKPVRGVHVSISAALSGCLCADGKGTVLACVDWGYYIDDASAASFYPAKPTAYTGAVQELTDSAKRWDNIAGNTNANLVK
jgi:hypothetical protein